MASWGFLTNHARVLLCIAHDPGMRLRDIAARLDITERSAHGIITDLTAAGYLVKQKDGRRNRYQIQAHLPLPEPASRDRTVGEVLALLTGNDRPGIELPPASDANGRRATQAGLETPPMPGRQADVAQRRILPRNTPGTHLILKRLPVRHDQQPTIYSSNILLVSNCEYRLRAAPGTGHRSCRPERVMFSA